MRKKNNPREHLFFNTHRVETRSKFKVVSNKIPLPSLGDANKMRRDRYQYNIAVNKIVKIMEMKI
jgi:hypothetical protein